MAEGTWSDDGGGSGSGGGGDSEEGVETSGALTQLGSRHSLAHARARTKAVVAFVENLLFFWRVGGAAGRARKNRIFTPACA